MNKHNLPRRDNTEAKINAWKCPFKRKSFEKGMHTKIYRERASENMIKRVKAGKHPCLKYNITKEFLIQKYIVERKEFSEIAKIIGCSESTVYDRFKKYGLKVRHPHIQ